MTRLLVALVLCSLATTAAHADALQNEVFAAARATPRDLFAFRQTIVFDATGTPRKVRVEQFDPRRPAAAQWTLVSLDGQPPTPKQAAAKRKHDKTPSYAEIADWFGAPATRVDGAPGHVTYRFARLPAGTLKIGSHDASADTRAEAVVNTQGKVPFVEHFRFATTRGFTMMLVASLKGMTVDGHYRALADGRVVPADVGSIVTGSMLGKSGEMRASVTYSDVQAVR